MREEIIKQGGSDDRHGGYGEGWPFFLVLTMVIAAMYVVSVVSVPSLSAPIRLIPFTLLCLLHGVLHWYTPRLSRSPRWHAPYLILQGAIIFVIALLSENQGMVLGLYLGMTGAALGVLQDLKRSAIPLVGYMALAGLNTYLVGGLESLYFFVLFYLAMALFVVIYVTLFGRQAEQRDTAKRLLAELEGAHRQLAEYAAQVEDLTLAAERQRMARELHDTLAQGLAGLILQLEAVDSHLTKSQADEAGKIVRLAMERARTTLAEARRVIADLRSEGLIDGNLVESVRKEVERFQSATGIRVLASHEALPEIPASIGEHAFRVIREGLTNIARHAQAHTVDIRIGVEDQVLEVRLSDDGVGFDPEHGIGREGHYGLVGLRERARLVGGSIDVESQTGQGTSVILRIPIKDRIAV